jgi:hypothetical protein
MSFFEPPPPPPEPPEHEHRQPPWAGPPDNVLPGVVAVQLFVARTQDTVVAVTGIRAYPDGLGFTLSLRLRRMGAHDEWWLGSGPLDDPFGYGPFAGGRLREEFLRFGVRFADGRKATNLSGPPLPHDDQDPQAPVLMLGGGGGGGRSWDVDYWLWPLPPPGTLEFVCAWPARHIPESCVEVDTGPILQAAGRAVSLWPDDTDPGEGGWTGRTWGTFHSEPG